MKILLAIIALLTWQSSVVPAQENSKQTTDKKVETVVTVIKQTGSLRFRCLKESGVFDSEYDLRNRVQGNPDCVNPVDLLGVNFEKQTLIGYRVSGDCHVRALTEVFRDDAAKSVRVKIIIKSGECRAVGHFQGWTVVEKLPEDYRAVFTETNAKESDAFQIELLEETFSLTEQSQRLTTRDYGMNRCVNLFREGIITIKSQDEMLKEVRDDASRKACLEKLETINFKKEILIGTTIYSGYCRHPDGLKHQVMRDDRKKRYVVFITYDDPYGRTCRALGVYDLWLAVPKPPAEYQIEIKVASVFNKIYD